MTYDPRVQIAGSGPPLVFVPGLEGTGLLFYRQIERLEGRHRIITFRLRDSAADMDTLVEDLDAVIAHAGKRPTLVGESFGGALALSYALRYAHKLERLVILNSFAYLSVQPRLRFAHRALKVVPWRLIRAMRRFTARRMHSRSTSAEDIRTVLGLMKNTTREGYLSRLSILQQYDVRNRLCDLSLPTLFLASDADLLLASVQHAEEMAARAPNATLRVLHGHGHACLVAPDLDLGEILRDWITTD